MKMNKSLIVSVYQSRVAGKRARISLADVNYVPQNTSDAPAIPSAALQQLTRHRSINLKPRLLNCRPAANN